MRLNPYYPGKMSVLRQPRKHRIDVYVGRTASLQWAMDQGARAAVRDCTFESVMQVIPPDEPDRGPSGLGWFLFAVVFLIGAIAASWGHH